MSSLRIRQGFSIAAGLLALLAGCARSHLRANAGAVSPGLTEDARRHGRSGTNPNAPFTLVTRSHAGDAPSNPAAAPSSNVVSPPCSPDDLGVVEVAAQVNGDQRFVSLAFVNNGEATCKLGGYPSLSLLDEKGAPVGSVSVVQVPNLAQASKPAETGASAVATAASTPIELILGPKGEAYFGISWVSGDQCPSVSSLVIDAPGSTRSFPISHPLTVCSGQVRVTALRSTQNSG